MSKLDPLTPSCPTHGAGYMEVYSGLFGDYDYCSLCVGKPAKGRSVAFGKPTCSVCHRTGFVERARGIDGMCTTRDGKGCWG